MAKFISAEEAAALIKDNMTVGIGGFGVFCVPDELLQAISKSYSSKKKPANLTAVAGICPGDTTPSDRGLNALKDDGLLSAVIAAHFGMTPVIRDAVGANKIAGYTIPLGIYGHLLKAIAGKKPGVLTAVGLHTFVDPRLEAACANQKAKDKGLKIVSLTSVGDKEYLMYHSFPIHACLIRGTYADEYGNISFQREAIRSEQLEMATATKASGGVVILQVDGVVKSNSIHARDVAIHHKLVDYIVLSSPENHKQGYDSEKYRPELTGDAIVSQSAMSPLPMSERKICARRSALELKSGMLVNLGVGIPSSVSGVAREEGIADKLTLSVESGLYGGLPIVGTGFGATVNPECVSRATDVFDLYDSGLLNLAVLGIAEIDPQGNVNVSKFVGRVVGPGGFINISQNTPIVCFVGTFTTGNLKIKASGGKLEILEDGNGKKFMNKIEQVTFSARMAKENKQTVFYITERAVFMLGENGLELSEIAPGVDLQKDVLDKMEFKPAISKELKTMDSRIFEEGPMGLFEDWKKQ